VGKKKRKDDFLHDFFGGEWSPKKEPKKKNSVRFDKFDLTIWSGILSEMAELSKADDKIVENVPTGGPLFEDMFYSLLKAVPKQVEPNELDPEFLINAGITEEAWQLKEWEELRMYTTGDEVAAGLGCIAMEETLEELADKLKGEMDLAKQLSEMMKQMQGLGEQMVDMETMEARWSEGEGAGMSVPGNVPTDANGAPDFQAAKDQIQAAMDKLKEDIEKAREELAEAMENASPAIQNAMRQAMKEAIDQQGSFDSAAQLWGMEPGSLRRLPAAERLEMSKKLNNPKFKRLAELFGPMKNIAFTEQYRKVDYAQEEMYDIELGNDLAKVLPTEFHAIRHPKLKFEFYRKFLEGELLQYKLRGREKVGKGGIVCCIDSSGSMSGEPDIWAKAFGLCLLHIAHKQKRPFYGIIFGSSREIMEFDFSVEDNQMDMDKILGFAEFFFGGGTDFMRPLSVGLDKLKAEFDAKGWTKSDIVFITDGICGVSDEWLQSFQEEQEKIGFKVYGIAIGPDHMTESEPLKTLCDGKVVPISSILNGKDTGGDPVREIFRSL
jgi:uncharacterized protein with von Willebrand factor type A (vWA) domain